MSYCSKEKMERSDCVNSIKGRSEREMFRVCPSKLSKRELEDLYFTLLENNLELKKTINKQQDNIRLLSTQVQRMTNNQEKLVNKEMKECCTGTRAFVSEQKAFITELKDTNQRLAERIQQLNMRLSSAKQFQKTSSPQAATARLNTPFRVASLTPKKHDCLTRVQEAPNPTSPYEPLKLSTFSQWEDKFPKTAPQAQISVPIEKSPKSDRPCDANKCRSLIDELKLEVVTLQEELSIVHYEYSTRISRLEAEVSEVRKENVRVSSERTASQHELQNTLKQNSDILARFRTSEAKCAELAAELSIEKRKVAELDTLLKAANLQDRVNKTMEEHLITFTETLQDTLQGTAVAPKETDENPLKRRKSGAPPPSKVTDGMAVDKNWLPEISKLKEVEDRAGKSSPTKTKYMPSKSTSSVSKAIKVELDTATKTRSKDRKNRENIPDSPRNDRNQEYPNSPLKDLTAHFEDRQNQEYPYPPPKDLSPRPEDGKNQEYPYPPPKDSSPRPEDRKNLGNPPYPPPNDLSTRLEDRKNQEYPYPPPKDLSPRPEEGQKLEYPPPKDLSPRPEDRKNQEYPFPPPKDLSTLSEDRTKGFCPNLPSTDLTARPAGCKCCNETACSRAKKKTSLFKIITCQDLPCLASKDAVGVPLATETAECDCFPPPHDEHAKCKVCCYPDPDVADKDKVNSPKGVRTRFSPTKEIDNIKSKLQSNITDDSHYESNEMALLKQNKHMLVKILELQNKVNSMKKGARESPGDKLLKRISVDSPPLFEQFAEDGLLCYKCCKKDKPGATESSSSQNDKGMSTRGAQTRFSPTKDKDDTKSTNTADDSGYQESDETGLLKMNKELLLKISELQYQVDCMKIGMCQMSEAQSGKLRELQETTAKSTDPTVTTAPIKSPPLLTEITKTSESSETKLVKHASVDSTSARIDSSSSPNSQAEFEREIEKPLKFTSKASEEVVNRLQRQKLGIEVLGNPKDSETVEQPISSDETRAKTVQRHNGTLQIPEDRSTSTSDEYIVNYDSKIEYKTPKLTITEKKKLEVANSNLMDIVSIKSGIGPGFNPEKLKYLENERIIANSDLENHQGKLQEDSGSITESVPSNPELGFGIPRLACKAVTSPAAGPSQQRVRNDNLEILPGKLKLPMTQTLAGNYPTATEQTNETKKEDCEHCAACSFDKECALKHKNALKPSGTKLAHGMQKEQIENRDLLNALQIPDATIPRSDNNKNDKKKNMFSHLMNDMNRKQTTKSLTKDEMFASQNLCAQKTSIPTGLHVNLADVSLLDQKENCTTNGFLQRQDSIKDEKKTKKDKSVQKQKKEDDFTQGSILFAKHTCDTAVGPVILPDVPLLGNRENRKLISNTTDNDKNYNQEILSFEIKTPTEEARLVERTTDDAPSLEHKFSEKASQAITTATNKAPRVSIKESARQRDVSMYRRVSGTICFRSVPVSQNQLACDCPGAVDGYCTDHSNKGVQIQSDGAVGSPRYRHRHSTTERGTYTVGSNRAETPDTDLEMSYLPDLPLENEKNSPGKLRPLSPGEDRATSQTADRRSQSDYSQPAALSEGEMPPCTIKQPSIDINKPYLNPTLAHKLETPPSQQMEAALNAITDELQRCKNMLNANRYDEHPSRASQTPAPVESRPIALKPALATQGIGNAHSPISVFTLHIGTVVLSDEAVLFSRNKKLILKWKFYNQPVTMARMRAGRVIVFDFSTQYDIKVTVDFLNYLRNEEMPIIICELEQEEQPFATATVPLRDALLLANTRADKSVALLAGPQMCMSRASAASLPPQWCDEVGVIDLWCMLRADASMVPGFNAIAQPVAAPKTQQQPGAMKQVLHDDNELDIAMGRSRPAAAALHEPTGKNQTYANVEYTRTSNPWQQESKSRAKQTTETGSTQTVSTVTEQHTYDISKYPPIRSRAPKPGQSAPPGTSPPPFAPLASGSVPSTPAPYDAAADERRESEVIYNAVNSRIKTLGDKVLAAGRNQRSESRIWISKYDDDTLSQAQRSSHGSLRSVLNRLHKRGSRLTPNPHGGERKNFIGKLRKTSKASDESSRNTNVDRANHLEMYKKYENIGKIGANRAEQSKKVTIRNEHNGDMEVEQPQRDVVQEPKEKRTQKLEVTVLWLALNEECEAMIDPDVKRLYVAYTFLGRTGAELETPVSLPKPTHYVEKCHFNFKKTFELDETDIPKVAHMAQCRAASSTIAKETDCIVFSVVSEPADDPLGIESCEDIGYAFLYLGDLLEYSAGSPGYTEVIPVRAAHGAAAVCGVLAVRLDGLDVVRSCQLSTQEVRPS